MYAESVVNPISQAD